MRTDMQTDIDQIGARLRLAMPSGQHSLARFGNRSRNLAERHDVRAKVLNCSTNERGQPFQNGKPWGTVVLQWRQRLARIVCGLALVVWGGLQGELFGQSPLVKLSEAADGTFEFTIEDRLLTRLHTSGFNKPILYPVMAHGQVSMTRAWPMEDPDSGETDHVHHKSIWYGHGDVNGIDFWAEKGAICVDRCVADFANSSVQLHSTWRVGETPVCQDVTTIRCGAEETTRWIDFDIRIQAAFGPVHMGDTKEGFMAIRTHPDLRLTADPRRGVLEVFGQAENSAGEVGQAIWGRPAQWVFYSGKVGGESVGIAILDHPENLRHPTTWHARDYGLIAANPFGLHEFLKKERGAGAVEIPAGEELRLRYRFVLVRLDESQPDIHQLFEEYANSK